jgi:hypothetical protein
MGVKTPSLLGKKTKSFGVKDQVFLVKTPSVLHGKLADKNEKLAD